MVLTRVLHEISLLVLLSVGIVPKVSGHAGNGLGDDQLTAFAQKTLA